MTENLASLLCYAGGWITGLIFLFKDKRPGVRFHAAQSIIAFGALNILYLFLSISLSPGLILDVVILGMVGLWGFLMFKAFKGERFEIPVVASLVAPLTAFVDKHFADVMGVSAARSPTGPPPEPAESFAAPIRAERSFAAAQGAAGISQAGISQGITQTEPAAAPVISRPAAPPPEPFDLKRGAVTSQLVNYIGYWSEADAARALGTATEHETLDADQDQYSYSYQDSSGKNHVIQLIFNIRSKILTVVSVMPWRVFLNEIKAVLGNEGVATDIQGGWKSYDYRQRRIAAIVDQDEFVVRLVLYGSDAASLFASSADWISRVP